MADIEQPSTKQEARYIALFAGDIQEAIAKAMKRRKRMKLSAERGRELVLLAAQSLSLMAESLLGILDKDKQKKEGLDDGNKDSRNQK